MTANDWWKTLLLFLWFYNTSAMGMLLIYFYGICRLSERRFDGKTSAFLLPLFFVPISAGTLILSLADSLAAIYFLYAILPAVAGASLLVVAYRSYRLMLGR